MLRTIAATALVLSMFTGSAVAYDINAIRAQCQNVPESVLGLCVRHAINNQLTPKVGEPYFTQGNGGVVPQSLFLRACQGTRTREECLVEYDKMTKNLPRID